VTPSTASPPACSRPRRGAASVGSPADIVRLALPALGALVAEPAFLLADSAMVGHLGAVPLAGVALASAVLGALVNCCVFLAYATTSDAARRIGGGDCTGAIRSGVDGVGLGAILGLALAAALAAAAPAAVHQLGGTGAVAAQAIVYLRISALGLPGILVATAATGVLRGLRRQGTALAIVTVGFAGNAALNAALIFGADWGAAGSAWGTVCAQTLMGAAFAGAVAHTAKSSGIRLCPRPWGMLHAARAGFPLVVRTMTMRSVIVILSAAAATLGPVSLAAYQLGFSLWMFLALALDAVAIAAQTIVGGLLGASEPSAAQSAVRRMVLWSVLGGTALGALLWFAAPLYLPVLAADPAVRDALVASFPVIAVLQPLAAAVYVLDGVLIGAGDGRYLAWAGTGTAAAVVPVAYLSFGTSLTWVWAVFSWFLAVRLAWLVLRTRGDAWMRLGT
jgi:putative MATE family efflux protein